MTLKELSPELKEQMETQFTSYFGELFKDEETRERLMGNFLESYAAAKPDKGKRLPYVAMDDEGNSISHYDKGEFATMQSFLKAVVKGDPRVKTLFESDGSGGGALVPDEFRNQLLQTGLENVVMRPRAMVLPMGGPTLTIPVVDDTDHSTPNLFGGIVAFWEGEGDTLTETDPKFRQFQLIARKLTGLTSVGNELMADSPIALDTLLRTMFGKSLAWFEDRSFINGSGAGEPSGIISAAATIEVAIEAGQTAGEILPQNIFKMYSRLFPSSVNQAIWIANPNVRPALYEMSLTIGTGGTAIYIPAGGISASPFDTLMGRQIIFTEHCPALNTAGDLMFVDPNFYVIGDRMALTVASSEHVRFTSDQIMWRFIQRVAGAPWLNSALTPEFGDTLSAFVKLGTRT